MGGVCRCGSRASILSKQGSQETICLLPNQHTLGPDPLTSVLHMGSKPYHYSHSFTPVIRCRMLTPMKEDLLLKTIPGIRSVIVHPQCRALVKSKIDKSPF